MGLILTLLLANWKRDPRRYKLWTELYPDEWRSYNALANDANLLGRYDTVVDASRQAIRLEPNHNFGYVNLLSGLIALNRLDEAKSICEQLIGRGHDDTFIHLGLFAIASLRHDRQALSREYEWAQRHPDNIAMRYAQAEADAAMGKVKQSTELFEEAAKLSAARGD